MSLPAVIRTQGIAFSVGAWLLMFGGRLFPGIDPQAELILLSLAIVFLGVPHGALDTLYARQAHRMTSNLAWASFAGIYVGVAAMVVMLWLTMPLVFLLGFLVLSAIHFSGDPVANTPPIFRALYGGAIIVFPTLLHVQQVTDLFSLLAGAETAATTADALHLMALPWLMATLAVAALHARKNWITSLEIISVSALAIVASPLVAFSMFFCGMHSVRHILRTRQLARNRSFHHLFQIARLPFALTLAAAFAGWYLLQEVSLNARVVQLVFVSLAALTVPHMMLVDRARFFSGGKSSAIVP